MSDEAIVYPRMSVKMAPDVAAFIRKRMEIENRTATQMLPRMAAVYKLLVETVEAGGKMLTEDAHGQIRQAILTDEEESA